MSETRWGSVEIWLEPEGFGHRQPINGPHRKYFSVVRQAFLPVPEEVVVRVLEELELSYSELMWGEHVEGRLNSAGYVVGYRVAKERPSCDVCRDPLPALSLETRGKMYCSSCGAPHPIGPAPYWLTSELPSIQQVYGGAVEGEDPPPAATDPAFGRPALPIRRWFVRMEGDHEIELELEDDESTEEEFLARLGVSEDPRDLHKALEYAGTEMAKDRIREQLGALGERVTAWEKGAAERATPWYWGAWTLVFLFVPLVPGIFAAVWLTPFSIGHLVVEESPLFEALLVAHILLLTPALFACQQAVQVRAGIRFNEGFSHVGFYAVIALVPAFGLMTAGIQAMRLIDGTLEKPDVTDGEGNLLRPIPIDQDISIGRFGWPAAILLLLATVSAQLTWLSYLGPYIF
ncbi:MAG: hypothetical protein GY913_26240 [Proteobacteria bacterium]|nr:hypothetical protein [Pseudomonadota bacterium]MCP4920417.1 hypothetical protein [Pseudomonadota bacterium]